MTRLRLGPILAAAAVVVALPRHMVAARFAAGLPAPIGPEWTATIDVSALSWAALEALVVFYLWRAYALARRRYLLGLIACVVFALAATNAPSLVADSLRIQLTELLPAAGPAHWSWAVASIGGNLLVVIAAGAADAAIDGAYLTTQVAELTDRVDKAAAPQVAVQVNTVQVAPQVVAAAQPEPAQEQPLPVEAQPEPERPATVERLLSTYPKATATWIARQLGVSRQAVSKSSEWRNRESSNQHPTQVGDAGGFAT